MATTPLYLPMDRRVQAKHTLWKDTNMYRTRRANTSRRSNKQSSRVLWVLCNDVLRN